MATDGEWMAWVKRHFALSQPTANSYMKLARESQNNGGHEFKTLDEVIRPDRPVRSSAPWHAPVQDSINHFKVANLVKERQNREQETRLLRHLAIQHCRGYALEAERKMGHMLAQTDRAKPPSGKGQEKHDRRLQAVTDGGAPTLKELGLTKRESVEAIVEGE